MHVLMALRRHIIRLWHFLAQRDIETKNVARFRKGLDKKNIQGYYKLIRITYFEGTLSIMFQGLSKCLIVNNSTGWTDYPIFVYCDSSSERLALVIVRNRILG